MGRGRQFDLGLFGGFLQALESELVLFQVDPIVFLELGGEIFDKADVEILAAQESIAVGRFHLEHPIADFEDGDVERAAAEIVDRNRSRSFLIEAVGERPRGRLIDDAQDLEARDLAGVLGRLPLGIIEISRNGNDRLADLLAKIGFGGLLHLLQNEGGNLRRGILFSVGFDPGVAIGRANNLIGDEAHILLGHRIVECPADQPLDREKSPFGIGDTLTLGRLAAKTLPVIGEGVVRAPSAFSITFGVEPSMTATQELVVPRSIPITLPMIALPFDPQDHQTPKRSGTWADRFPPGPRLCSNWYYSA